MLGILRTILSLFVFSSHLPQVGLTFHIGVLAVTIFYFISGMLMWESFQRFRASGWLATPKFYLDRFMRIYPAFMAVTLVTAVIIRTGHEHIVSVLFPPADGAALRANINLLNLNYHAVAIVNPAWSLAAEAQFYVLLPLLAVLPFLAFALVTAGSLAFHVYCWHAMDLAHADYWGYRDILGMLFVFCMGMCFARRADKRYAYLLAAAVAAQLVLLFLVYPLTKPYANTFLLVILLGTLIATPVVDFARRTSADWLKPIDRFVGNLCYPIFLVHFPAMYCTDLIFREDHSLPKSWFVTAIGLCLLFALAVHFLIQIPSEKARYALRGFKNPMKEAPVPMKALSIILLIGFCALPASAAQPPYSGPDYSGTYDCKGEDGHDGAYTSTVTLKLVKEQSWGKYAAYAFEMKVPGFGTYPGHAAAEGKEAAIYFANVDQANKDYGTGIARFSKAKSGKWQFTKYYYEPEYQGGNYGTESCIQN